MNGRVFAKELELLRYVANEVIEKVVAELECRGHTFCGVNVLQGDVVEQIAMILQYKAKELNEINDAWGPHGRVEPIATDIAGLALLLLVKAEEYGG